MLLMTDASDLPWYRTITRRQWNALLAAKLGWMLDAMDFALYLMAIPVLKEVFDFGDDVAGLLGTVTLLTSAAGGLLFGLVADRIGRTRALMTTVLVFSICSLGSATAQSFTQLLLWRAVLGIGMGGEWASGAVLVSETWPAEHRGKAIGIMQSGWALGYILAAVLAGLLLPTSWGWRGLFAAGILPALFVIWVRHAVPEPEVWARRRAESPQTSRPEANPFRVIFGRALLPRTVLATLLTAAVMFAYWGLFTWLPAFLATPQDRGGAGMDIRSVVGWIVPTQTGAFLGYLSFGFIAERIGRRPAFIAFLVAAAILVPLYGQMAPHPSVLMALGPLLGFVGHGYFSLFGALLAELFPTAVRATGQGFTYNVGRALSASAPYTIGVLAKQPGVGIGLALALTSAFFLLGAALILALPDTSGKRLED
jgi:MFS family permease